MTKLAYNITVREIVRAHLVDHQHHCYHQFNVTQNFQLNFMHNWAALDKRQLQFSLNLSWPIYNSER